MPLTLKDMAPFITPYTSPAEYANANARVLGNLAQTAGDLLRNQAQQGELEARKAQWQKEAVQHGETIGQRRARLKFDRDRDQADAIAEYLKNSADMSDEEMRALAPALEARGIKLQFDQTPPPTPVAPSPVAPAPVAANPYGTPQGAAPPAPNPYLAPPGPVAPVPEPAPAAPSAVDNLPPSPEPTPQAAPETPPAGPVAAAPVPAPAPAQPSQPAARGKMRFTTVDDTGRASTLQEVDLDARHNARVQRSSQAILSYMAGLSPVEREKVLGYFNARLAAGGDPATVLKEAHAMASDALDREQRAINAQTIAGARTQTRQDRLTHQQEQMVEQRRDRAFGRIDKSISDLRVKDKLAGAQYFRDALSALDSAGKNPALVQQALTQLIRARDSRPSDFDVKVAPGQLSWLDQAIDFFSKGVEGDRAPAVKANLRGAITNALDQSNRWLRQTYDNLRTQRDLQRTPDEWDAQDEVLQTLFSGEDFYERARLEDEGLQQRMQAGQGIGQGPDDVAAQSDVGPPVSEVIRGGGPKRAVTPKPTKAQSKGRADAIIDNLEGKP